MFMLLPTRVCSRVGKTTDRSRPHFSYTSRLSRVRITYTDISEHPETNLHLLETRNPRLFAGLLVSLVAQTSWDLCQLACSARPLLESHGMYV